MTGFNAIYENAQHLRSRGIVINDELEERVGTLGVSAVIGAHDHASRNKQWELLSESGSHLLDIMYTTKRTPKSIADLFLNEELEGKATAMKNQASAKLMRAQKMLQINKSLKSIYRELHNGRKFAMMDRDAQRSALKAAWDAAQL